MPYLCANIDRAIVMTQFDIRGFWHPLGFRMMEPTPKNLDAITCNLLAMAAGIVDGGESTDESFVDYFDDGVTYESYLAMCNQLAKDCGGSQREAIQLLVEDLVKMNEQLHANVKTGAIKPSNYLFPLERDNRWGRAILGLREAFPREEQHAAA